MEKGGESILDKQSMQMVDVDVLQDFKEHTFRVAEDPEMDELKESIRENGVVEPILIFVNEDDMFEIISGHRRVYVCKQLGIGKISAVIKEDISRDDAIIMMGTTNLKKRSRILPSERASTYKLMYEAMKRQGRRSDVDDENERGRADEEMTKVVGGSRNQIHRFIKLCDLIPEIMELVDEGRIKQQPAQEIADMHPESQKLIYEFYKETGSTPTYGQARILKKLDKENLMDEAAINEHMRRPREEAAKRFRISATMWERFFSDCSTQKEVDEKIIRAIKLLEIREKIRERKG